MNEKVLLRKKFKEIRKSLNISYKSTVLCKKLRDKDYYKNAVNILIFYPLKYEIDTLELLNDNKKFFLPRVKDQDLEICPYKKGDDLKISDLKICEPLSKAVNPDIINLAIVPALSADKNNYRLGYGGGFYDRFLKKFSNIESVILLPEELMSEKLPADKFDQKVDYVITA